MIAYFPEIYPDELIYSLLARYYTKSGYPCYWYAAEDLFISKTVKPDIEFINKYTSAAIQAITRDMSMEEVMLNHTMYPFYGRFLPLKRRKEAYKSLVNMQGHYHNLLPMPKKKAKSKRHLKYCPVCATDDRKKNGESYWHRVHQMVGIDICPYHHCRLIESIVLIDANISPDLISAEMVIADNPEITMCDNEIECNFADYMTKVFYADMDLQFDVAVGDFLHSRMANSSYRSVRGEQRNISLFHADFSEYYKSLPDNSFTELWQIQKVLNGYRYNFHEICMLAMFLNIPAADLVQMKLPEKTQEQLFDETVFRLHKQGLKYTEIAKKLNASYDVVKSIGEQRYKVACKEAKKPLKCRAKTYDWKQIDNDTLPLVRDAIRELQGDGIVRPRKVTVRTIEKMLKLPSKRISHYLPICKAEIEKNHELQEQYWAREVVWAASQTIRQDKALTWWSIIKLTNLRKCNFQKCIPYLNAYTNSALAEKIKNLI